MPELIDRQAALEVAMRYCPDDDGGCSKAGHDIREMLDEIEALPTIEAKLVRRGRWKTRDGVSYCSNCGSPKPDVYWYYCGFCGADLRTPTEVQLCEADDVMMG